MTRNVLIVEDDKLLARGLEAKLTHEGLHTTIVGDGAEALKTLASKNFDIVLLDLVMPSVDGFEVLEKLRAKPSRPIVFVLTNLSQHEDEQRSHELGAKRFFVKSDTSLDEIVAAIKDA